MKVKEVNKHVITEVINTDGGQLLVDFITACLDGKKDDLYKGNSSDTAQLNTELESIVNKIGEECFNAGYTRAIKDHSFTAIGHD